MRFGGAAAPPAPAAPRSPCHTAPTGGSCGGNGPQRAALPLRAAPVGLWAPPLLALLALLSLVAPSAAWPYGMPAGVSVREVASGFGAWLTDIEFISPRFALVSSKSGRIWLLRDWQFQRGRMFIDLTERVRPAMGDRGLTSMAVHPDFLRNPARGFIYVAYVDDPNKGCQSLGQMCQIKYNRINRYELAYDAAQDTYVVVGSPRVVFGACTRSLMRESWWGEDCSPMVWTTHALGDIWFGSDGKLWASVGEGQMLEGSYWRENWRGIARTDRALSMDVNFLGGKILRMEANTPDGVLRGLPDNPFYDGSVRRARSMVWAVGLRQPWRCTHYPPGTTREVICGTVGFFTWESVMRIRRGSNLGFPCWEARARALDGAQDMPICQRIYNEGAESVGYPRVRLEDVLFVYPHDGTSAASIGGVILPSYFPGGWANHFIFTDYARGTMWTVNPANPGDVKVFAEGADNIVSFRTSPFDGYVYMVLQCRGCGSNGRIRRLEVRGYRPPTITSGPKQTTTKRAAGPVNTLCSPPNRIRVSPLPREPDGQQWETVMWLSKGNFPRSRLSVAMNGGWGPIGMDTSVGPAPNSANSRSRVISVGREFFTAGLGTKAYSVIDLNLGAAGRCWKFVADVGIDDEIHIGRGEQAAWAEFVVRTGQSNGLRLLYSTTDVRQAQGLAPLRARDPAWRISITNLTRWSGLRLVGNRPDPARYPFDFDNAHLDWASARLYCGPEAPYLPDVQITAPTGAPEAAIGQTVQFSGRATNWDGTEITAAASFEWNVVLVHCQGYLCHQHSEVDGLRGRQGSFVVGDHAPTAEQYYFYQIDLVVRDACGRSDRATKTVKVRGFSGER